jgi:hypothetical protein
MKRIILRGDWIEGFHSKLAIFKIAETPKCKIFQIVGLTQGTSVEHENGFCFYHFLNYNYKSKRQVRERIRDALYYI